MMQSIFSFILVLFFSSCSFETPPNEWQYKSASAFSAYTEDFLSGDELLAKDDLARTIKYAKKSADLETLARVYLGKCALNITVGVEDNCKEYVDMASLIDDANLQKYYELLTKKNDVKAENILDMSKESSQLLNGALHKEELSVASREKLLHIASYHGYKKVVLFWLREQLHHSDDAKERRLLQKKIDILTTLR